MRYLFIVLQGLATSIGRRQEKSMGVKDSNYQVVKRGESLPRFVDGGWVFFQRLRKYGGGFWVVRTCTDAFIFGIERPVPLTEGMQFMIAINSSEARHMGVLTAEEDPNLSLF